MRYLKNAGIRLRWINAAEGCIISIPGRPGIRMMNSSAWLILESCNISTFEEIVHAYEEATGKKRQALAVHECLLALENNGIINAVIDPQPTRETT